MNKYIVLHNIQSYNFDLIKCNILFLLFLNHFKYFIKRKCNTKHNIVDQ